MSTENKTINSSLYRGKCETLAKINEVEIDISALVEEKQPVFFGEPVKRVFSVRSKLTWFRLKFPGGNIVTEIQHQDEFVASVNATVYDGNGNRLANGHGSADTNSDETNKLVEAAESRAISRALDFAGFGCQLDQSFDEFERKQDEPAAPEAPVGNSEVQFPNEAPQIPQPGVVKGKKKVDANAPSGIVDISEFEKGDEPKKGEEPDPTPKKSRKAKSAKRPEGGEQVPAVPAHDADSEDGAAEEKPAAEEAQTVEEPADAAEATQNAEESADAAETTQDAEQPADVPDAPAEAAGEAEGKADEETPAEAEAPVEEAQAPSDDGTETSEKPEEAQAAEEASEEPVEKQEAPEAPAEETTAPEAPAEQPDGDDSETKKTAMQLIEEHIAETIKQADASGTEILLDPKLFTEAEMVDGIVRNRIGEVTQMNARELQLAYSYLQKNPEMALDVIYPSYKGIFFEKTFREVIEHPAGKEAIYSCVKRYVKNDVSAYAAALILYANAEKEGGNK